ncbi:DUF397 domain-containing protein [Streptomyces palmae]|uniref:DUF397 domain-containing protein n=1 Tax=Streptomyces palmae TaxID=1701085 RepID=A0A4Z0GYW6_9ACTN|nr:DUF397 domain-containing protein [Streptomyces palmae]TGB02595.1 DUF397 domain-containing protein [Streptomyces palmae]
MSDTNWQKSSFSGDGEDNHCVELAHAGTRRILLRESDNPAVVVATRPGALGVFLRAAKAGAFDAVAR